MLTFQIFRCVLSILMLLFGLMHSIADIFSYDMCCSWLELIVRQRFKTICVFQFKSCVKISIKLKGNFCKLSR